MDAIHQPVGFWIARMRKWANTITREPEIWHTKISEIEALARSEQNVTSQLIELLCAYSIMHLEVVGEIAQSEEADSIDRPPLPLIGDIVSAIHTALSERGTSASTALISAYETHMPASPCCIPLLLVLADLGDPSSEELFEHLKPENLEASILAADAISEASLKCQSDFPLLKKPDPSKSAQEIISGLLYRYRQSVKSRADPIISESPG